MREEKDGIGVDGRCGSIEEGGEGGGGLENYKEWNR
jgi:hypothetical protein